jgi:phenylacetate-coenzyme A ligase PaaK-like adenylate-forming protein
LIAAGSGVHATRALASLFAGDFVDITSISATDPIETVVAEVEKKQPMILQGYPSVIRRLAEEKLAGRLMISPMAVTVTSEPLTADARACIDEAFGVGVSDMFGSSEGVLGVSPPDDPAIVLASDTAIVELVDEHHQPVEPGVPSAKVLVTNLANQVQPLIRYELTDSFVEQPSRAPDGHLRVAVAGRSDDELHYGDGVVVHPLAVRTVMVKVPEASEYQVRQTPDGVDIAVVASAALDTERVRGAVADELERAGLREPSVHVRVVSAADIERHPETAKTKRFIRLPA